MNMYLFTNVVTETFKFKNPVVSVVVDIFRKIPISFENCQNSSFWAVWQKQ